MSGEAAVPAPERSAWLVTGDDASLVAQAVSNLVNQLVQGAERALVLEDYGGEDTELGVVVDACTTPPFLADRRVVVLRDAGNFSVDQLQPLISYLEDPLPTTRLVVAGGGGALPAKLVNAFKQAPGATLVNTDVSNREAHDWVSQRLAHGPVKLVPTAAALVEEHLGEDLNRLGALLATLEAAYGHGARIEDGDLRPYLGEPGSVPPWDLTDAIDKGQTDDALKVLHRLLEAGGRHPLVVLAVLQRHFGNVLRVQSPAINSEAEAAQALGMAKGRSTFPARKALDAARRLGPGASGDAVVALADAELALKGKLDLPPELVLEVLVARLCRLSRAARGGAHTVAGGSHRRR
ncbi:MAG: DNA polymerase III subunit delta [Acidimicrobiales bacterium]